MTRRSMYILACIFVAGVILGLIQIFWWVSPWDHIYSDMHGYIDKGRRMFGEGMGEFDAFYPLGTAYLNAIFFYFADNDLSLYSLGVFHVLCVALSHVVIGLTAYELFKCERVALFTAGASLVYWPLTAQSSFYMSEPVFLLLCLIAQYCYLKILLRGSTTMCVVVSALCIGMACITKTQGLVFIVSLLMLAGLKWNKKDLRWLSGYMAIFLVIIAMHSSHISKILDQDGFYLSANGAFNLYLGQSGLEATGAYDVTNNTFFMFYNNNVYFDRNLAPVKIHLASVLDQAFFSDQLALLWQEDQARQTLRLFVSAFELFSTEPHWPLRNIREFADTERAFKAISLLVIYLPLLIAISIAIGQRRFRWEIAALLLPVLGVICASALTFGQPRYLLPFMPNIIAVAAFGWVALLPVKGKSAVPDALPDH